MGCVHSRVDREETVQRSRERRRLMKQLLSCRAEFAAAHMAYLQSLRNTGATLRQFAEVESIIPCNAIPTLTLPPSPPPLPPSPPPLPPSPPPPPHYSPDKKDLEEEAEESSIDSDDDESCTPPPPPVPGSEWDFWDPFGLPDSSNTTSPVPAKKDGGIAMQAALEEENWAETNTEFEGGEEEEEMEMEEEKEEANASNVNANVGGRTNLALNSVRELLDDNSSAVSGFTKDTDMAVVAWRSKKTLAGSMKQLDDYFLKAAAGGKDVAVLLESNRRHNLHPNFEESKGNNSKSVKVFNVLSWSWSSRSPHSSRDGNIQDTGDACRSGNHCTTLEKLYAEEQRLYKEVKEEEIAKFQHKKKTLLLQKLETTEPDQIRIEKTRSNIEYLQSRIVSLQESINGTCLLISKLRDEDLHPQLVQLSCGLVQMWRTMYECHQVQNHMSQQANLIDNQPGIEPTTDSHRHATVQLETEVNSWYSAFCNLVRSQREYIHVLNQWVRLTDCLPDNNELSVSSSGIHALCEEWQLTLDRLPAKVAAEAIKSFVSIVHSIVLQQTEEHSLQKKSERLESKLERELNSFHELENMVEDPGQATGLSHQPLSVKHAKLDGLKKRAEEEKAKFLNSVRISRAMTLNNLQTSLPNVFQALMCFASVCVQALEGINQPSGAATGNSECFSSL